MKVKIKSPQGSSPLQIHNGGSAKPISINPFSNAPMIEFSGKSHKKGGIDISWKGSPAEVQGKETAIVDDKGDMNIMGNMQVPGTNKTFQSITKDLAKKEKKAYNTMNVADDILASSTTDYTRFGNLKTAAGNLMGLGATMRQQTLDATRHSLVDLQNAMLETAKERKLDPEAMSKGKVKKATKTQMKSLGIHENGGKVSKRYKIKKPIGGPVDGTGISFSWDPTKERSLAVRNNNPGNIKFVPNSWMTRMGAVKGDKGFAKFPSMQSGLKAIQTQLKRPLYGNKTVGQAIKQWTNEGLYPYLKNNDQFQDIRNKKINQLTGAELNRLTNFITKGEDSKEYNLDQINNTIPTRSQILAGPPPVAPIEPTMPNITAPIFEPGPLPSVPEEYRRVPNEPVNTNPATPPNTSFNPETDSGGYTPTPLPISSIVPELVAYGQNTLEGAQGQSYTPRLYQPYQVSYQDNINQNTADFRGIEQLTPNNPEYLSSLAAKKYQANNRVKAQEFRTNQGIANRIINMNTQLLNKAGLTNLGLADQQYVRNETAKAKTKAQNMEILQSIADKYAKNNLMNKTLQVYSNMYPDYSYDTESGKMKYTGNQKVFPNSSNGSLVKEYKTK